MKAEKKDASNNRPRPTRPSESCLELAHQRTRARLEHRPAAVVPVSADTGTDTLGHHYVKVPVGDFMTLTQRAKAKRHSEEPKEMRWFRNGFWASAAVLGGAGLVLTAGRIERWFSPDTSVIVWSIALMLLSAVFAVVVQMTINKRVMIAEIRDARPADTVVLGEMATELQENRALIRQLIEETKANERQRTADFDMIRDNSRKALDAMHDQIKRHDDEMYRGFAVVTDNQIAIHAFLKRVSDSIAASGMTQGLDPTDPKYLADMSEAVRLGEEIAMRKLRPPDQASSN